MHLQVLNMLLCLTAHGISLTCSSHVTTTVWLSDRHLSLLSRCHSGQRESPRRLQSRSLRQHGRPTDALPTGRPRNCPGSRRPRMNTRAYVSRLNKDFWVGSKMINQHLLKQKLDLRAGETELEPWFLCIRRQDVLAHLDQLTVAAIWCTERRCVFVFAWCVFVIGMGVGGGGDSSVLRAPSTSVERVRLHGEERCADILLRSRLFTQPGRCAVCLTLVQMRRPN